MNSKQITDYYDQAEIDYKLVWDLDKSLAMHYGFWNSSTKNLRQALERENEVLAKMAKIKKSDKVLDCGCGVGGSVIFLVKRLSCKAVGISLSNRQVQTAKNNSLKQGVNGLTEFYQMDFTKMEFPKNSFEVVWGIEAICHADDKSKFIKEAFRILKNGGRLIVADGFATKDSYAKSEKKIMDSWLNGWGVENLETPQNFQRHLKEAGFKKIEFKNVTNWIMPSSIRLYRLSFPAFVMTKIGELLGLRNKIQTGNVLSAYYQYHALKKNLALYGIFYAEK